MLSIVTTHTHTHTQKSIRKLLEVMDIFITLIMMMVSLVYTYVKTHQIVQFLYITLIKL